MNTTRSDALVFFGATGDLAYKKIFPSLQALARIVDPVLHAWRQGAVPLQEYPAGSTGPPTWNQ